MCRILFYPGLCETRESLERWTYDEVWEAHCYIDAQEEANAAYAEKNAPKVKR